MLKNGILWSELPKSKGCGCGMTCFRSPRTWQDSGSWQRIEGLLKKELRNASSIDWERTWSATNVSPASGQPMRGSMDNRGQLIRTARLGTIELGLFPHGARFDPLFVHQTRLPHVLAQAAMGRPTSMRGARRDLPSGLASGRRARTIWPVTVISSRSNYSANRSGSTQPRPVARLLERLRPSALLVDRATGGNVRRSAASTTAGNTTATDAWPAFRSPKTSCL